MTIASEITRINNNIQAAYTACNGKGATMPQTQNSANLSDCISSITSGGGRITLYAWRWVDSLEEPYNDTVYTLTETPKVGDIVYMYFMSQIQYGYITEIISSTSFEVEGRFGMDGRVLNRDITITP